MTKPTFNLMDSILLSAEPEHVLVPRTPEKLEVDYRSRLGLTAPPLEQLQRAADRGKLERIEQGERVAFAPTVVGLEAYFADSRRVAVPLRITSPFKGTLLEALAHWFDNYFSPGSAMMQRVSELGLPGVAMGGGTKWRAMVEVFRKWNNPYLCNYFSYFLVEMLDPQQWMKERAGKRSEAVDRLNAIFSTANFRVHEKGYLVPVLRAEDKKVSTDAWDDEARFRAEVVKPLLERLPGLDQVILTHGTDEFGRDFLVAYRHPIRGDRRWIGIQVKAGDVSGAVKGQVNPLVEQVKMMFQHPFKDIGVMERVHVSEAMILVSGEFTDNAKELLRSRLES